MKYFVFLIAAMLVLSMGAMAQTTGYFEIAGTVATLPIAVTNGSLTMTPMSAGITYVVPADPLVAFAFVSGPAFPGLADAGLTWVDATITGDPMAYVLVTCNLPSRLYPTTVGLGYIDATYNSNSGSWGVLALENFMFDPRLPVVMQLDAAAGTVAFVIGGNFTVAPGTTADTFEGSAVFSVAYTGL